MSICQLNCSSGTQKRRDSGKFFSPFFFLAYPNHNLKECPSPSPHEERRDLGKKHWPARLDPFRRDQGVSFGQESLKAVLLSSPIQFESGIFIPLTAWCDNAPELDKNAALTQRDRLQKLKEKPARRFFLSIFPDGVRFLRRRSAGAEHDDARKMRFARIRGDSR